MSENEGGLRIRMGGFFKLLLCIYFLCFAYNRNKKLILYAYDIITSLCTQFGLILHILLNINVGLLVAFNFI